eukprot:scaffold8641_cov92-Amphora_coffeaeformis.AAC.6
MQGAGRGSRLFAVPRAAVGHCKAVVGEVVGVVREQNGSPRRYADAAGVGEDDVNVVDASF